MTTLEAPGENCVRLDDISLAGDTPQGPAIIGGLSLLVDLRGFTIVGPKDGEERTVPWGQASALSFQEPSSLPDGRAATVLRLDVKDRALRFLVPSDLVPPTQTVVVESRVKALASRSGAALAGPSTGPAFAAGVPQMPAPPPTSAAGAYPPPPSAATGSLLPPPPSAATGSLLPPPPSAATGSVLPPPPPSAAELLPPPPGGPFPAVPPSGVAGFLPPPVVPMESRARASKQTKALAALPPLFGAPRPSSDGPSDRSAANAGPSGNAGLPPLFGAPPQPPPTAPGSPVAPSPAPSVGSYPPPPPPIVAGGLLVPPAAQVATAATLPAPPQMAPVQMAPPQMAPPQMAPEQFAGSPQLTPAAPGVGFVQVANPPGVGNPPGLSRAKTSKRARLAAMITIAVLVVGSLAWMGERHGLLRSIGLGGGTSSSESIISGVDLTASDLGPAWVVNAKAPGTSPDAGNVAPPQSVEQFASCMGSTVASQLVKPTDNLVAESSPIFTDDGGLTDVSSQAAEVTSAESVQAQLTSLESPHFPVCMQAFLGALLQVSAGSSRVFAEPAPSVVPLTGAAGASGVTVNTPVTITGRGVIDLATTFIASGQVEAEVSVASVGRPVDPNLLTSLSQTVARRAAAASQALGK